MADIPDHPEEPTGDADDVAETQQVQLSEVAAAESLGPAEDEDVAPTEILHADAVAAAANTESVDVQELLPNLEMNPTEQMNASDIPSDDDVSQVDAVPPPPEETPEQFVDRMVPVVEGLIFAAEHPLTIKEMIQTLEEEGERLATSERLLEAVERVKAKYRGPDAGLTVIDVAGGFAFRTAAPAARYLRRSHAEKPFKMGRAALETLAMIAYRQPVTKAQIDELRGVDSSGALKALLDKNLVRVLGKAEEVGRPLLYGTTKTFLEAFNLKVLADLPTLREYQELTSENQARVDAQAPIQALGRIRDLAKPGDRIVSLELEAEGAAAMRELDLAVGDATTSGRAAEVVLAAGGKLPPGVDLEKITRPPAASADGQDGDNAQTAESGAEDEPLDEPSSSSDADEDVGKEEAE